METRKTTINYLWIGPPSELDPHIIAGHDVAGPISMAQEIDREGLKNKIQFWCLEEHIGYYRDYFEKKKVNISVNSIESLIKEEKKPGKQFNDQASSVETFLNSLKNNMTNSKERIIFKDLASLFILLIEGGYFFDTNVFPTTAVKENSTKKLNLNGEPNLATAKSELQKSHDFFVMYSPYPNHPEMIGVFKSWIDVPAISKVGVFNEPKKVDFLNIKEMGISKKSYKSYYGNEVKGLFFWQNKNQNEFKKYLQFGKIDQQVTHSTSMKVLVDCSFVYDTMDSQKNLNNDKLLSYPFKEHAYIAIYLSEINQTKLFYVNKIDNKCELVGETKGRADSAFDDFPKWSKDNTKLASQLEVTTLIKKFPDSPQPPTIINNEKGTLLHHAVMMNDLKTVQLLINEGAKVDLKASYKLMPSKEMLEPMTPFELAKFLKHTEIAESLASHSHVKQKNPQEK